jgi:Flp pilus assembly protein TadD
MLITAAVLGAYAGTCDAPFIFDDIAAVTQNPSIRQLTAALAPPPDLSVSGRPLVNLTLALNFAWGGTAVAGYHLVNVALHLASSLLLCGLVRRAAVRLGHPIGAEVLAASTALLWALHPLATSSVTYVMQRTELLVSCGAISALYAFVRGSAHPLNSGGARGWLTASVLACAAAMCAKEVAVVIPLLIVLADRTLRAPLSLRATLGQRRGFYAALFSTWVLLGTLLVFTPGRGGSAGLGSGVRWSEYAVSQLSGLATYLKLTIWPSSLIFDRGMELIPFGVTTILGAGLLICLIAVIGWSWHRNPLLAWALTWYLLLLAPSSSVVPIATQTLGEHRVYLASFGLMLLAAVAGLRALGTRRFSLVALAIALPWTLLTVRRNRDYATLESIWADTVLKAPTNARAHFNYGLALEVAGQPARALAAYAACLALENTHAEAHAHAARLLQRTNRHAEAGLHFESALRFKPDFVLHNEAAVSLLILGDAAAAARHFEASLALWAEQPLVHYNLGLALQRLGRYPQALEHLEAAARLAPEDPDAVRAASRLRAFLQR